MGRVVRRVCVVMMLVTSSLASSLAAPAWACGCGAYLPNRAGASVSTERALIAWDGTAEDIVMAFSVSASSERAAWVMPVPSAAEFSLGDPEAFDELVRLTAPASSTAITGGPVSTG
jgi:hypothetical protein